MNIWKVVTLTLATGLPFALSGRAELIAYWDMDASLVSGKLGANSGSQAGAISASIEEIVVGFDGGVDPGVAGTALNASGSVGVPNLGVGFYRVGVVYESGSFLMEGFDFTGLSDVGVSFAYDSFGAFTWNSNLHVDYRIGEGSWVDFNEEETWLDGYVIADIPLPEAVDGQGDVDIRIRTNNWVSTYGFLDVDNVQVNAVPEYSQFSIVLGISVLGFACFRRRKTVS
tara:strand:+ start:3945 stop:4628 length:684 start_codon:yes stop_codon:yes gene_type:complete